MSASGAKRYWVRSLSYWSHKTLESNKSDCVFACTRSAVQGISQMNSSVLPMRSQGVSGTAWREMLSCVPCLNRRSVVVVCVRYKKNPVAGGAAYPSEEGTYLGSNCLARPRTGSIQL